MEQFVNDVFELIKKYQLTYGMTYAEGIGFLALMQDELSERCRRDWKEEEND